MVRVHILLQPLINKAMDNIYKDEELKPDKLGLILRFRKKIHTCHEAIDYYYRRIESLKDEIATMQSCMSAVETESA